ncbi:MAG TPA: hypothetical protein VI297_02945, partial [Gemmatimonadales bacterium]
MGCLLAPFRALGCLVILAGVAAGWLYRDRVLEEFLRLTGRRAEATTAVGRPGTRALAAARARTDSVARSTADSIVLSPSELASLIGAGLTPVVRDQLDSLTVRLLDGQVEVGGRITGSQIPREVLGPLALAVSDRPRIRAAGAVDVVGPGRGEWVIERLDVGGVPVPADALRDLL